jgi:hypothetical protein
LRYFRPRSEAGIKRVDQLFSPIDAERRINDESTQNLHIFPAEEILERRRNKEYERGYEGMMDILFAKGLGLTKKKKDNELKKLLRDINSKREREETHG